MANEIPSSICLYDHVVCDVLFVCYCMLFSGKLCIIRIDEVRHVICFKQIMSGHVPLVLYISLKKIMIALVHGSFKFA